MIIDRVIGNKREKNNNRKCFYMQKKNQKKGGTPFLYPKGFALLGIVVASIAQGHSRQKQKTD